jgi:1,4-dihydroxy-2-naphthoate octaprenyltransferase
VELYVLSFAAVILIMWMTYYISEWGDLEGDRMNKNSNPFSGGSKILVERLLPSWTSLVLGYGCLGAAVIIGLTIFFRHQTGPWTLPLGAIGIFSGFFYSIRPFRWAYRGLGEVLIGICYSWLPIATGFYLFTGFFNPQVFFLSIPVGLSIVNVILLNEFPDEDADRAAGKRNVLVRFGKEKSADLTLCLSILIGLSFIRLVSILRPLPFWLIFLSMVPLLLLLWNFVQMWRGGYRHAKTLETLCRNGLLINLSMTMILTIQLSLARFP